MNQIRFERLSSNAKTPIKATPGSAGFDLFSGYSVDIPSFGSGLVLTDISIKMPRGIYARIAPRSGLAIMYGLSVGAGVIGKLIFIVHYKISNQIFLQILITEVELVYSYSTMEIKMLK
jgi:dUTPase